MKKILMILAAILLGGCSLLKPVPVETIIKYEYRDSTRIKDSTVLNPIERIKDIVPVYDSLKMETSMAKAQAWVDTTTHTLKGKLENKRGIQYKYIYKDRIIQKDSIITKEVPVEVEKILKIHYPYEKYLWAYLIGSLLVIAGYIFLKIKKIIP